MQVRTQGQKVVLIRSKYSKERKRCIPHQIAWIHRSALSSGMDLADGGRSLLGAEQWELLTAGERKQLADWLAAERDRLMTDARRSSAASAAWLLQRLAEAFSADEVDAARTAEISAGLAAVRRVLRRRQRKARDDGTMHFTTTTSASDVTLGDVGGAEGDHK